MNKIAPATLKKFRGIPTQTIVDALWVMGWPNAALPSSIKPVLPPSDDYNSSSTAGQAVTLRRPFITIYYSFLTIF